MIEPGVAYSPANNLTPKYLGFESRKFLAVPPDFFVAIVFCYNLSSMNIAQLSEKIKGLGEWWALAAVALAFLLGYGLGILSNLEINRPPLKISTATSSLPAAPTTGQIVASKNGTKYHELTCPGAKQIVAANRIYFASPAAAEAAGYTRAANCQLP